MTDPNAKITRESVKEEIANMANIVSANREAFAWNDVPRNKGNGVAETPVQNPRYNILFTQPRTCSHLLLRMINTSKQRTLLEHPTDGYLFMGSVGGGRFAKGLSCQEITEWTDEQREGYAKNMFETAPAVDNWLQQVQARGKSCIFKEHISWIVDPERELEWMKTMLGRGEEDGNTVGSKKNGADPERTTDTVLSDMTMLKMRPTFLIRHPALAFPSLARASDDVLQVKHAQFFSLTYHWSKTTYEWYKAKLTDEQKQTEDKDIQYPIVLDADDIMDPRLVCKYAAAIGLDTSVLQFEWETISKEELEKTSMLVKRMKDTLFASKGIIKAKSSDGIVIEDERKKWESEFGKDIADRLAALVQAAMEDYLWLKERRMRIQRSDVTNQMPGMDAMNYSS